MWEQTRAHALLKGKDAELRDARGVAEAHFADKLRSAEAALSSVHRDLNQVIHFGPAPKMHALER